MFRAHTSDLARCRAYFNVWRGLPIWAPRDLRGVLARFDPYLGEPQLGLAWPWEHRILVRIPPNDLGAALAVTLHELAHVALYPLETGHSPIWADLYSRAVWSITGNQAWTLGELSLPLVSLSCAADTVAGAAMRQWLISRR